MARSSLYFATRLAWRQLTHEKGKLLAAIMGVMFASILVFMQLGFRDSLYDSVVRIPKTFDADIFILHRQSEALWRMQSFPRSELARALASPDVVSVAPLYVGMAPWRNPQDFTKRTLIVYGYAPEDRLMAIPEIQARQKELSLKDTLVFDRLSRPEFGKVDEVGGTTRVELNDVRMNVVGAFSSGPSFAADGNAVTSDQNFLRIFSNRTMDDIDIGFIRVRDGADVQKVKAQLRAMMTDIVYVFDHDEMMGHELAFWQNMVPVGFVFGFGVLMGLAVGVVIVYQILYTDISNHLKEYATLKAMGYGQWYLFKVVLGMSVILALMGFIPGWIASIYLYDVAEQAMYIDLPMPFEKVINIFVMIFVMCIISGVIAMRKLRHANPAEMF
jgi:putative ABC transport system permease protein